MNNYHKIIGIAAISFLVILSCSKKATDYQSFLNGNELVYPGVISSPKTFAGKNRILLTWNPNPDPSVTKYVVYWNNYSDSITVNASSHNALDTVKCPINNLSEYVYSFFVYSFDKDGNRSVITEINNAKVYGTIYQQNLHNRNPNTDVPYILSADQTKVTLNFLKPDTINIMTNIKYISSNGSTQQKSLSPDSSSITLTDYKLGTRIAYQSSYIPSKGALDTFISLKYDTFPPVTAYLECDKSLFSERKLSQDADPYESGTSVSKLWDGSTTPQGYPNIFHSDGSYLPHVITFDLGKTYNALGRIEETGRNCCHNPIEYEVWGINDLTNAITTLRADNSGWTAEALSKGWVLLARVVRSDDGINPSKADFIQNAPPVRYIRIRVIKTATGNSASNMSEVTLWNKI